MSETAKDILAKTIIGAVALFIVGFLLYTIVQLYIYAPMVLVAMVLSATVAGSFGWAMAHMVSK